MTARRPCPIDSSALEQIRLQAKKAFLTSGTGAILRRKLGQSLEYREHRAYAFGDDVRHIDWRASLRHGGGGNYLMRSFEAEEQFSLLVMIDDSATMRVGMDDPARVSKLEIALWICEALKTIAQREKLRLAFSSFSDEAGGGQVAFAQGERIGPRFDQFGEAVWQDEAPLRGSMAHSAAPLQGLKQSSVTILITDFYQTGAARAAFEQAVQFASRGYRQAIVCELNSWPTERAILSADIVSLKAIGETAARPGQFQASASELAAADSAIATQRAVIRASLQSGGVVHIPWDMPMESTLEAISLAFANWFHHFIARSELFGRAS